ncbi:MAG: FecR domain-containing protein [Flavihumibacter sp.]
MNNHEPFDYEALIVRGLTGEASAEELQALEQWRQSAPVNEKQFADRQRIWQESKILAANSTVDVDAAWNRFRQHIEPQPAKKQMPSLRRMAAVWIVVIGTAVAGWLGLRVWQTPATLQLASADSVLSKQLPDGSDITLNKSSQISYPGSFTGNKRRVQLRGEAFFNIVRDSSRPFVVEAGRLRITVLGTSFNVKQTPGATEVIVASGKVKVERDALSAILLPGTNSSHTTVPGSLPWKKKTASSINIIAANNLYAIIRRYGNWWKYWKKRMAGRSVSGTPPSGTFASALRLTQRRWKVFWGS